MPNISLHTYLSECPDPDSFSDLLSLYGFTYEKTVIKNDVEPTTDYYKWLVPPISGDGFDLLFFHTLFPDDLNKNKYEAFLILSAGKKCTPEDYMMMDLLSVLLIRRYGGMIHNPQKIDKISTGYLLSGKPFSPW